MKWKEYPVYKDPEIEWMGNIPDSWEIKPVWMLFTLGRGRVINHENIGNHSGEYPVYSSQTEDNGILGFLDTYDFDGNYLTWTTDGANAGTVFERHGKFNCTNVCGTLLAKESKSTIGYFKYAIDMATQWYVRHDINPKLMNNVMSSIRIPSPNYDEQKVITDFLNRETERIDTLIAKKRRQIELLQEKRSALISHVVTKGLNSNVKMKDSRVEWLGEIPEHWDVIRLKFLCSTTKGLAFKSESFCESGVSVVKASDIKNGTLQLSTAFLDKCVESEYDNVKLKFDDILISTVGSKREVINSAVGQIAKVPKELDGALLNQNIVRLNFDILYHGQREFLFFTLFSNIFRQHLDVHSHGTANQASINVEDILNYPALLPPDHLATQIVQHLSNTVKKIDILIARILESMTILQEYRIALISAAVTGKIDVRQEVA